jgi:hypothetical protein
MVGLKIFLTERKMFEEHVTRKILTLIEPQGGARDPDRRLDPDPGYAFQGVKISCVPELKIEKKFQKSAIFRIVGGGVLKLKPFMNKKFAQMS